MSLRAEDLAHFTAEVRARTGISLEAGKEYLIESRLAQLAGSAGCAGVGDLLRALRVGGRPLTDDLLEAMTTNETFFFRDATPFEHLRRLLSAAAERGGTCRVWSAACSTGQEPYSVAMLWEDIGARSPTAHLEIVATDLSDACLSKARAGIYSAFEANRGLTPATLLAHFDAHPKGWAVKPHLQRPIAFRRHNLLEPASTLGRFDIILCRNVMIYFEPDVRRLVLGHIANAAKPGARLILGASETIMSMSDRFTASGEPPGLYRLAS